MNPEPSAARLIGAVLAAAGVAALPTFMLGVLAIIAFPVGFAIAMVHALLLGLPAYKLLRRRVGFGWGVAALVGFLVGALPAGLILLPLMGYGDGAVWTAVLAGLCGILGALTFRAALGSAPPASQAFDPAIWK